MLAFSTSNSNALAVTLPTPELQPVTGHKIELEESKVPNFLQKTEIHILPVLPDYLA